MADNYFLLFQLSFFTSTECHLQYAVCYCWIQHSSFMSPMNKIIKNIKMKLYPLVLIIYLITNFISRAMY